MDDRRIDNPFGGKKNDDEARLDALNSFGVLDTPPEERFDELAILAARVCGAPMAIISLVDEDRVYFKASIGLTQRETSSDGFPCSQTIREGGIFQVADAAVDPRFSSHPFVSGGPGIRFYAGAPLLSSDGYAVGALSVMDRVPGSLDAERADALMILARQAAAQLELRRQSVYEPLTGLLNRRFMEETLRHELSRAGRDKRPLGMILIDVDHLRKFNEKQGHAAGDALLKVLASFLKKNIRAGDFACRYGGEEFVLLLPGTPAEVATNRAESIRSNFKRITILHQGKALPAATLSIGVAIASRPSLTPEAMLTAVDRALIKAKIDGADRVVVAEDV